LMSFSIALAGFGLADCRKALKRFSVSIGSFMDVVVAAVASRGLITAAQLPCG